jgi:hypothetical protein
MFRIHMLPALDGDCFLVETGSRPHRLLIDGGRRDTAAEIETLIGRLDPVERRIDLVVLTHIDEDHIAGLVRLIESSDLSLGEVWFNGLDHARLADGQRIGARSAPAAPMLPMRPMLGVKSARDFARAVTARGSPWNASLPGGAAWVEPNGPLPSVPLPEGGRVTLLGPPRAKLAAFAPSWEAEFEKLLKKEQATAMLGGRAPVAPPRPEEIAGMAVEEDDPDTSKVNGTSIVLVIDFGGRSALFAADAHPGDVSSALARLRGEGRAWFDAVKVPHHGSARNNTSELIGRLDSPLWLISTNGAHEHPHREAMARILLAPSRGKRLVFNHRTPSETWADAGLAAYFGYRLERPAQKSATMTVDLLDARLS